MKLFGKEFYITTVEREDEIRWDWLEQGKKYGAEEVITFLKRAFDKAPNPEHFCEWFYNTYMKGNDDG